MTCQELLAFSVAFSAALPTNQNTLDSFYSSLARTGVGSAAVNNDAQIGSEKVVVVTDPRNGNNAAYYENFSCCYHLYQSSAHNEALMHSETQKTNFFTPLVMSWRLLRKTMAYSRRYIKAIVDHKYFQQGILLAILINTLSMGIEYHDQPEELTAIVETSNIVFSGIFAVEMLLKVIAEGPFKYIANGFNVFDGVIVILRYLHRLSDYTYVLTNNMCFVYYIIHFSFPQCI